MYRTYEEDRKSTRAAHVTGAIALIKSKYPNLSNKKIEQLLKKALLI
ncbi:serine protease [Paenibacillus phage Gohan]|nr:serine protease [Paenibacillus phage Gohan]